MLIHPKDEGVYELEYFNDHCVCGSNNVVSLNILMYIVQGKFTQFLYFLPHELYIMLYYNVFGI